MLSGVFVSCYKLLATTMIARDSANIKKEERGEESIPSLDRR
jgi:hypothetical protein